MNDKRAGECMSTRGAMRIELICAAHLAHASRGVSCLAHRHCACRPQNANVDADTLDTVAALVVAAERTRATRVREKRASQRLCVPGWLTWRACPPRCVRRPQNANVIADPLDTMAALVAAAERTRATRVHEKRASQRLQYAPGWLTWRACPPSFFGGGDVTCGRSCLRSLRLRRAVRRGLLFRDQAQVDCT